MGYVLPPFPFRPNLDRFGLPRDYETYKWLVYGAGRNLTPERRLFLYPARDDRSQLPLADPMLMGYEYK